MPEENNSSPSETQRAPDGMPQRGTPNEDAASQRDTAGDEIRDPEKKRLHEEAVSHKRRAKELEAQLKAYQDAEQATKDAQLTESQRLQKERDELQAANEDLAAELLEHRVNQDISKLASKFNFTLSADLISKLLDWSEIEWDEEQGKPLNIEKLLEKLAKNAPELVKPEQQQQRPPALPANNPGRTTYGQPGGNVPGKRYTLDDIQWSR